MAPVNNKTPRIYGVRPSVVGVMVLPPGLAPVNQPGDLPQLRLLHSIMQVIKRETLTYEVKDRASSLLVRLKSSYLQYLSS
jgi:hypothetical protein